MVGGGPAGCAAAFDLAVSGIRVGIIETRTFPRIKPCGGALTVKALRALRFSIDPVVRSVVTGFVAGREYTRERHLSSNNIIGAMTIRHEFDSFMLDKAMDAGADFVKIERLSGIEMATDGIRLETDLGILHAPFVVAADGANSTTRKLLQEEASFHSGFAIEAQVSSQTAHECRSMTFDFGVVPRGYGWVFPKGDHYNVGLYTYDSRFNLFVPQLKAYAKRKLGEVNLEHVVGHAIGLGAASYEPKHERVFLVGDAGGFCDPLLGEGIFYAIRSGQIAAEAIREDIANRQCAGTVFRQRVKYLRDDLRTTSKMALMFYRDLGIGYLALISPPVRYALMKGFSFGIPLGHIPAIAHCFPFRRVEPIPSVAEAVERLLK